MNPVDLLLWGLVGAAIVHSLEEYKGGFIQSFPPVVKGFKATARLFWAINIVNVLICAILASVYSYAPWLGLAVPAASLINVLLHVGAAFKLKKKRFYSPGLVSAIVLYLPLSCLAYYEAWATNILSINVFVTSVIVALIGYMGLIGSILAFALYQKKKNYSAVTQNGNNY
jgi:hypothetical protein